jgi:hypothetical protein
MLLAGIVRRQCGSRFARTRGVMQCAGISVQVVDGVGKIIGNFSVSKMR